MNTQKSVYIFVGPPGSGKGTLSYMCVKNWGWVQLSTGNLCRKHIAEQTELGKQIDFALKSGKLVPDDLINQIVYEWFSATIKTVDTIILDGYPRTLGQARELHNFLQNQLPDVSVKIVRFFISDESVVNRICGRLICKNKDCQEVYSLLPGARNPSQQMKCDTCLNELGRRNDDAVTQIRERLTTYHKHENDLLNFYKTTNYFIKELEVEKQLDEIFDEFKKLLNETHTVLV